MYNYNNTTQKKNKLIPTTQISTHQLLKFEYFRLLIY
jgi:hypothetical protein